MDMDSQHPITTPKGAALVTLLLAVLGVFAPFFASLVVALCFAAVAIGVILWIYWSEIEAVRLKQASGRALIFPGGSVLAIFLVAALAISVPAAAPDEKPTLTLQDVERGVSSALAKVGAISEKPEPAPTPRPMPDYRIVIEEPKTIMPNIDSSRTTSAPKAATQSDYLTAIVKKMERRRVEFDASLECDSARWKLDAALTELVISAANSQNQFHNYNNPKQMLGDYNLWIVKAKDFLQKNKSKLPDASVFDLATGQQTRSIFIGPGTRAWLSMDAKRQALESLQTQLRAIPCDKIGKAAVVECEENGNCSSVSK
jgi:hypothetical protein